MSGTTGNPVRASVPLRYARRVGFSAAVVAAMFLAGCVSSSPEPDQMSRTTLQTAPADLQLLCASAVGSSTGAVSDAVLPVSSQQIDASTYQVDLNANGVRTRCIVDSEGNVRSIQPA